MDYCLGDVPDEWVLDCDDPEPDCATNDTDECGLCGGDGAEEDFDCGGNCIADGGYDCNNECGGGAIVLCNSVASGGGEYCAPAGTEVCGEYAFNDGDCADLNEWHDCAGNHCGSEDPLFYETGCADEGYVGCDGGRCYTCSGGTCSGSEATNIACSACTGEWGVETTGDCDDTATGCADVHSDQAACDAVGRTWEWFVDSENNGTSNTTDDGDGSSNGRSDECYCAIGNYASYCSSPADANQLPLLPSVTVDFLTRV